MVSLGNMWSVDSLPSPQSAGIWLLRSGEAWHQRCCLRWNLAIFEPSRRMLPSNVRNLHQSIDAQFKRIYHLALEALPSFTDVWVELELNKPSTQEKHILASSGIRWKTMEKLLKAAVN